MHPMLVAALAEDRHRRCPCSAVTQQSYRLCHGCHHRHRVKMLDHVAVPPRRSLLSARHIAKAVPSARLLSVLASISEGTGN